jgi:hypothetical protein
MLFAAFSASVSICWYFKFTFNYILVQNFKYFTLHNNAHLQFKQTMWLIISYMRYTYIYPTDTYLILILINSDVPSRGLVKGLARVSWFSEIFNVLYIRDTTRRCNTHQCQLFGCSKQTLDIAISIYCVYIHRAFPSVLCHCGLHGIRRSY